MCERKEGEECPLFRDNPGECPFVGDIASMKTDIKWLRKGYWIQVIFSIGTFLTFLGLLFKVMM